MGEDADVSNAPELTRSSFLGARSGVQHQLDRGCDVRSSDLPRLLETATPRSCCAYPYEPQSSSTLHRMVDCGYFFDFCTVGGACRVTCGFGYRSRSLVLQPSSWSPPVGVIRRRLAAVGDAGTASSNRLARHRRVTDRHNVDQRAGVSENAWAVSTEGAHPRGTRLEGLQCVEPTGGVFTESRHVSP